MDADRIRQLVSYDQEAGVFTWLVNRKGRAARIGDIAGCVRPDGYVYIGLDGKRHYAHRIAWILVKGEIPDGMEIDHIDHNPANNRISNLRLVTKEGNRKNRGRDSRNKSGFNGVHWSDNANAWCVQVRTNGKVKHVGYFKDINDAAKARLAAQSGYGFHENHGATSKHKH